MIIEDKVKYWAKRLHLTNEQIDDAIQQAHLLDLHCKPNPE